MVLQAAFIFLSEDGDPTIHCNKTNTTSVCVSTFAVKNYEAACELAKELVQKGIMAIELCGGFGIEGVALIKEAVQDKIPIGVVRFDCHPGLNYKSGDSLFKGNSSH